MAKKKKNGVVADTTKATLWEITYREDIEAVIRELNPRDYAYIKHDRDKEADGKEKKLHYHIWCRWDTPVRNSMIKRALGLTGADYICRSARSQKACILYLTHETKAARKLGKFIYDRAEIVSNLDADELERIYASVTSTKDELMAVLEILEQYQNCNESVKEYNKALDNADVDLLEVLEMPNLYKKIEPFNVFLYELITNDLIETYNKYYNSVFRRIVKAIWGD